MRLAPSWVVNLHINIADAEKVMPVTNVLWSPSSQCGALSWRMFGVEGRVNTRSLSPRQCTRCYTLCVGYQAGGCWSPRGGGSRQGPSRRWVAFWGECLFVPVLSHALSRSPISPPRTNSKPPSPPPYSPPLLPAHS